MTSTSKLSAGVSADIYVHAFCPPPTAAIFLLDILIPVRYTAVSLYVHHTDPAYPLGLPLPTPAFACVFGLVHHGAIATAVKAHSHLLESIILVLCANTAPAHRSFTLLEETDASIMLITTTKLMQLPHLPVGVKGRRISMHWT